MPEVRRAWFRGPDHRLRSGWAIALWIAILAACAPVYVALAVAAPPAASGGVVASDALRSVLKLGFPLLATWICCRVLRQPLGDAYLGGRRLVPRAFAGFGMAILAISAIAAVPWALGSISIRASSAPALEVLHSGALQAAVLFPGSAAEEVIVHGFLLQQLVRGAGRTVAIGVTACLFAFAHFPNPNLNAASAVSVTLFGILLGIVTVRSGSVWFAIGFHVAWNYSVGFLWGSPVSGLDFGPPLLEQVRRVEDLWTGGLAGIESTLQGCAILAAGILLTAWWPAWRKTPPVEAAALITRG